MEYFSVDRIEDGVATLEKSDRSTNRIPAADLPQNTREGDCLRFIDGAYVIDAQETARRRKRNQELFDSLLDE